jgi:predicted CoA-binding protein
MIVSKDINPERDVYYLGAKVIEVISSLPQEVDFFDVYKLINSSEEVSMNLYALTLDWLYIIGIIENSESGNIRKCF